MTHTGTSPSLLYHYRSLGTGNGHRDDGQGPTLLGKSFRWEWVVGQVGWLVNFPLFCAVVFAQSTDMVDTGWHFWWRVSTDVVWWVWCFSLRYDGLYRAHVRGLTLLGRVYTEFVWKVVMNPSVLLCLPWYGGLWVKSFHCGCYMGVVVTFLTFVFGDLAWDMMTGAKTVEEDFPQSVG